MNVNWPDAQVESVRIEYDQVKIEVRQGGLSGKTLFQPELGDKTDEMVVANAIVTVYVP
jgi:hypothetical protein